MLGEDGLLRIMRVLGDVEPQKLIETLLGEIETRYPENLSEDDVTVLVVRANGRRLRFSLREKLRAFGTLYQCADARGTSAVPRCQSRQHRRRHHSRARPAAGAPGAHVARRTS